MVGWPATRCPGVQYRGIPGDTAVRRVLTKAAFFAATLSLGQARAAPPAALLCNETRKVDCFDDEIFIVDGDAKVIEKGTGIENAIISGCTTEMVGEREVKTCETTNQTLAFERFLSLLEGAGAKGYSWDTLALFLVDMGSSSPFFVRNDDANAALGIGYEQRGRGNTARPYTGHVVAGNTTDFGVWEVPKVAPPDGVDKWPDPDPAGVEGFETEYKRCSGSQSTCFPFYYNGYQALAQASSRMFGPFVHLPDTTPKDSKYSKSGGSGQDPAERGTDRGDFTWYKTVLVGLKRDISFWNSMFDLDGSLWGGNNWRANGDGSLETTGPTPFWAASPPYQGKPLLRFHPIELYLMGLIPARRDLLAPVPDYSSVNLDATISKYVTVDRVTNTFQHGQYAGLAIRPNKGFVPELDRQLDPMEILAAEGGRSPNFDAAPHVHKQQWIVITKPNDPQANTDAIRRMKRWRRAWNAYYSMLTSYRGRMVTTFDGTYDDSPVWEFGQPTDDIRTFLPDGGLQVQFVEPTKESGASEVINSFVYINVTPGAAGVLRFASHSNQPPILIKGAQNHPGAYNALTVRMRIGREGVPAGQSFASLKLGNGTIIRLPSNDRSFLVPDGRWHTYSANLSTIPGYTSADHTSFEFSPSSVAGSDIALDSIRFGWVDPEKLADADLDCARAPTPDGYIDTEDNCPDIYNPDQTDEDGNGKGDACEDFDLDGAINRCDNCPTLTNSRQRDRDDDSIGDTCDSDPGSGCFLQPQSVAGSSHNSGTSTPVIPLALLVGAGLFIRRRKQKKQN